MQFPIEIKLMAMGISGFFMSILFDLGEDPVYGVLKYAAVVIPTAYTIWKWVKDYRDE